MPAEIIRVTPGSPAAKTKIAAGDVLLSINNHAIQDVLDYRFYAAERKLKLILQRNGKPYKIKMRKGEYEDLGLEFADGLMDSQRHCKNKCVFCFIDQLPPGLRESLYFKDDDARLG
ncbi:MAG: PDZ domain-containing protein, partial [Oscillospiraceae bacterium]|nr:PDZ domain-containing protein [Oscillospiraceae bacterium]